MKKLLCALLAVAALVGCGGEDTIVDPPPFAVIIEVADPTGAPVAGLDLALAPDGPWYGEKTRGADVPARATDFLEHPFPCPFNPGVTLVFELDANRDVHLAVEDVEGGLVATLVAEPLSAGRRAVVWNGDDDAGQRTPSGVYRAHLIVRDEVSGEVVQDQTHLMLRAVLDPGRYSVGTTDRNGRIVLSDSRLFPYLYEVPDFPSTDESGERTGTITLVPTVRFNLADPTTGALMRFTGDVTGSVTTHRFTWDPAP